MMNINDDLMKVIKEISQHTGSTESEIVNCMIASALRSASLVTDSTTKNGSYRWLEIIETLESC